MQEQNLQSSSSSSKNEPTQFGNGADKASKSGGTGDVLETAKNTSMDLLEKAKSTAGEAYGTVTEKATSKLEEGKVGLSGGLSSVASSVRKVADGLNESTEAGPVADYSARYAQTAAEKLEAAAGYFESQDLAAISRDVESFARRNTAIFLGAAFALGILAARFIKSSPSANEPRGLLTGGDTSMSTAGTDGIKGIETGGSSTSTSGDLGSTGFSSDKGGTGLSDPGLESSARGV